MHIGHCILPLDGLTDREFESQYSRVTWNHVISDHEQFPRHALALGLSIGEIQNFTTPNTEKERKPWGVGDWMLFLHKLHYKPQWIVSVEPGYSIDDISLCMEAYILTPKGQQRLGLKLPVYSYATNEKQAMRLVEDMIREMEENITKAWLR